MTLINGGISPAQAPGADGDGFVEEPNDVHIVRNSGTTPVVAEGAVMEAAVDGSSRRYAPQPGNGRE